ncbi:MAG: ATP synthase F1 subunit gamma [Planctomycetota bacterium]|jgi:F-type H+-transporting ATPase subunit gamma
MANIKELRGRISSVAGIKKITAAMEMVASMRLRKVQGKALSLRPYTYEIRELIDHLAEFIGGDAEIPLFQQREVKTTGVLVISSDRGLCGAYNSNAMARLHELEDTLEGLGTPAGDRQLKIFCYGKKGYSYLHRRGYQIERLFVDPPLEKADFQGAKMVSTELLRAFEARTVDEVYIIYTGFASVARFVPTALLFLPAGEITLGDAKEPKKLRADYILEPDPEAILNRLIPRYPETVVFDAMLESLASEHASRRIAMKGATDAAGRMGTELKRGYNRVRQESITKELLDIVGGANAVE